MNADELTSRAIEQTEKLAGLTLRVDRLEGNNTVITELVRSIDRLAINMSNMADELTKQGARLERLEENPKTVDLLSTNIKVIAEKVSRQGVHIERLESEPGESYKHIKRTIASCAVTGVLTAIIGAVLALIIK